MTTNDSQLKVKESLIQVFDELSAERKVEVLEFALFMRAREIHQPFYMNADMDDLISQLQPAPSQSSYPLQGSVLYYDDPFEPVAAEDWEVL